MRNFLFLSTIFLSTLSLAQTDYRVCSKILGEKNDSLLIDENSKLIVPKGFSIKSQNSNDEQDIIELIRTKNKSSLFIQFKKDASGKIIKITTGTQAVTKQLKKNKSDERVGVEADIEFIENRCYFTVVSGRTYYADDLAIKIEDTVTRENCLEASRRIKQCDKAKLRCTDELEKLTPVELNKMTSQIQMLQGSEWKFFFSDGIMKGSEAFINIFNLMFACSEKFYLLEKENENSKVIKEVKKI